jgi:hypothetical protein
MANAIQEYSDYFGEETVPYLRDIGEEAQESAGWGSNRNLFRFSAPFEGAPQYITLYASYRQPLADQHPYGGGNDPLALTYGAIFPSSTASVATRLALASASTWHTSGRSARRRHSPGRPPEESPPAAPARRSAAASALPAEV